MAEAGDDSVKVLDDFKVELPFGPPPVLPDVTKQLKEYLLRPDRLPIHDYKRCQKFWPRKPNPAALYTPEQSPLGTTLRVERDPTTGKLLQFKEVTVDNMGHTAKNSLSLHRAPGALADGVRGSSTNFPFFPGGFDQPDLDNMILTQNSEIDFENDLLEIPPEFEEGLSFQQDGRTLKDAPTRPGTATEDAQSRMESSPLVNLMHYVEQEQSLVGLWKEQPDEQKEKIGKGDEEDISSQVNNMSLEDGGIIPFLPDNIPVLNISSGVGNVQTRTLDWAEEIDVSQPITDFHKRLPVMAHTFPFELDTFQKQAVLKLEEHANVFVAAHTSAGKTVVAEYAIALSHKHMTRTIYTSPIKALSNQKFRDFKKTFKNLFSDVEKDVGLLTGDIQINPDASCLIMTTEILRSMLYCGSDVIRDLEYVIFDEVHYINDQERGHVWEEVLILLPQHVSIVMLSATVPNTLEFADWVGRTKQKKMYVISTLKRPVPLKHYLYTGFGGKTKHECFPILNANDNKLLPKGLEEAIQAKKSRQTKFNSSFGPQGGRQRLTPNQEKTLWVGLLDHLTSKDLLPVVAFTLSRNRCDTNSEALSSVDLTTAKQKSHIHHFFQQSLNRLKDPDKVLPQIVKLRELLSRGIGVHHSGILPILKEIVEILFQEGYVKLLFATETFAMGVNMPARTVVFDSIRKFDGVNMRTLLPAEYIQMAGRAGRRGIDDTGTVMLLCKGDVPKQDELVGMMLGKPEVLASQFRLTYSMILNLLRVDSITVEGMMSRSFKEVNHRKNAESNQSEMTTVEDSLQKLSGTMAVNLHHEQLTDFYNLAAEYVDLWEKIGMSVLNQKRTHKDLVPGRVLLITHKHHVNKLALILRTESSKRETQYRVLVLNDLEPADSSKNAKKMSDTWYKMISFADGNKVFVPTQAGGHCVVTIPALDIFEITGATIKVDFDLVIKDWEQRLIPRFSDFPPSKTCLSAVQELAKLTHSAALSPQTLQFSELTRDMAVDDTDMIRKVARLATLKRQLATNSCIGIANFQHDFQQVFTVKQLESKWNTLKFLQSHESMSLYDEYQQRIKVLKRLNYIDDNCTIQLKGRVACNMGQNELIITELVFRNILVGLQPPEIAALLSCLVFQQRTDEHPDVIDSLKKGIEAVEKLSDEIKLVEKEFSIGQEEASRQFESLNFGLVQVVHEWAREKPFAQIMELTDVQEGIIVRCMQQLNETLNDVKDAAHMIGDPNLSQKMEDASTAIKRDIVFAASLYTVL